MLILVGLGNPGASYERHRHNVGFVAVDAIADAHGFGPAKKKFHGEIREGFLNGPTGREKAILLKPLTFMNESGRAVRDAMSFYKLAPEDIIVFHDELDLAAGKIKAKLGGGIAGHNGLRSIAANIGPDFRRVRIGIGHPGDKSRVTGHVLGNFAKSDADWLDPLIAAIAAAAPKLADGDAAFTTGVALHRAPAKPEPARKDSVAPKDGDAAKADSAPAASPEKPKSAFGDALSKLFGGKS